jgi:hypothetical protein
MELGRASFAEAHVALGGVVPAPAEAAPVAGDDLILWHWSIAACGEGIRLDHNLHRQELGCGNVILLLLGSFLAKEELMALLAVAGDGGADGFQVRAAGICLVVSLGCKLNVASGDKQVAAVLPSLGVVEAEAGEHQLLCFWVSAH